jgi:hypothetical protein
MIQMANDEVSVTDIGQPVQQCDGITPAGYADEIATARRKVAGYS